MARPKGGLINALAKVPALLKASAALEARIERLEKSLFGAVGPARRGRKPGRKRGRKPGRKPGRPAKRGPGRPKGKRRGRKPASAKRLCSVPGCGRPHNAKGLCANHYQQALRKKKEAAKA